MLEGFFYTVESISSFEGNVEAKIKFQAKHPIFNGHFPGKPIVPGVCMVQIVRELLEKQSGDQFRIVQGDHIKFLKFIDPITRPDVEVKISVKPSDLQLSINATLFDGDDVLFKFTGSFQRLA
jgi:3-hydroxyacyl-[acyl-carrier-protein] dehydratase